MTYKKFISSLKLQTWKNNIDNLLLTLLGKKYLVWRNIVKNKIKYLNLIHVKVIDWHSAPLKKIYWHYDIPVSEKPALVTAVILFVGDFSDLKRQLNDIKAQSYKYLEILILVDNNMEALSYHRQLENLAKDPTIRMIFCQKAADSNLLECLNEGVQTANGKFLWILEPKEQFLPKFLEKMLKLMEYQSVLLAFSWPEGNSNKKRTALMAAPVFVERILKQETTLKTITGIVLRNPQLIPKELIVYSQKSKENFLTSKWLLLLWIIRGGCIGYTTDPLASYLKRETQNECSIFKDELEIATIERYFANNLSFSVLMCCSNFMLGGGETFAIHLANELYRQGIVVTVIDFHMFRLNEHIRKLLNPAIPVVTLTHLWELGNVISQLDGNIIHSHHGNVDEAISLVLQKVPMKCNQFITLHGMYEAMPKIDCQYLLKQVSKTCTAFAYIADKNLEPFKRYGYLSKVRLIQIENGLPQIENKPLQRCTLNIPESAFVLCLASRGIREKGWAEGIQIVEQARKRCGKDIHLIILGDGEMRPVLELQSPPFIHFMGAVFNVRDYFSMSDAGFLPSYFKGESFPLVVIEALMCGIPVVASDLGEIKKQLADENDELAGALIPICNWKLDIEKAVEIISTWAGNEYEYQKCRQRVSSAAKKMDIQNTAKKYIRLYQSKGVADFE